MSSKIWIQTRMKFDHLYDNQSLWICMLGKPGSKTLSLILACLLSPKVNNVRAEREDPNIL